MINNITVIVPTFNNEKTIINCLESILGTDDNIDVIVIMMDLLILLERSYKTFQLKKRD